MTKDEAWEAFKFTIYSDQPFTAIEEAADAYAQAAVDKFKADTLGMLEKSLPADGGVEIWWWLSDDDWDGLRLLKYPGHKIKYERDNGDRTTVSRVEAEALLKEAQNG